MKKLLIAIVVGLSFVSVASAITIHALPDTGWYKVTSPDILQMSGKINDQRPEVDESDFLQCKIRNLHANYALFEMYPVGFTPTPKTQHFYWNDLQLFTTQSTISIKVETNDKPLGNTRSIKFAPKDTANSSTQSMIEVECIQVMI